MSDAVKQFEIQLEHDIDEQYQYEPGELMKGKVILVSEDDIRVRSISIQVKGEVTVSWTSEDQTGETFSTNEVYVDDTLTVFGSDGFDFRSEELSKGEHSFPFEYVLPGSLPSSFIGKLGSVAYILKATLREDRPGGLGTSITTEPFLVLRPLDLNLYPELKQRRSTEASRRTSGLGIFCCLFGKTVVRFSVNKTGFLPGEDMIIDAEISNDASQPVKSVQAVLLLSCTFQAMRRTRTHTQAVLKKTDNVEIDFEEKRKWNGVRMTVPAFLPESKLDGCDMIHINYELNFRLEMADGSDVTASIPITIGSPKRKNSAARLSRGSMRRSINGTVRHLPNGMLGIGDVETGRDMESDLEKFRHPMIPGETRKNILFDANMD